MTGLTCKALLRTGDFNQGDIMRLKAIVKSVTIGAQGLLITFMGAIQSAGALMVRLVSPTFGANIAVDLSLGNNFVITVTSNAAHALTNPINGVMPSGSGMVITVTEKNTSGGAIATMTFGTAYKLGAAWTAPADGFSRSISFLWDGTVATEIDRTAADVAN